MRRALLTLGGTAAGLAALFSFKSHSLAADPPTSTPAASATASQPMATGTGPGSASSAASGKASAPVSTRTVTGAVANTQYGPMQVQVTLAGMKITKVTVLQRTNTGAQSEASDANAIPKLTSETLVAQSARIDAVSGASYTSSGYVKSLQSALDQAAS